MKDKFNLDFIQYYNELQIPKPDINSFGNFDFRFKLGFYMDFFLKVHKIYILANANVYKACITGKVNTPYPSDYLEKENSTLILLEGNIEPVDIFVNYKKCVTKLIEIIYEPF